LILFWINERGILLLQFIKIYMLFRPRSDSRSQRWKIILSLLFVTVKWKRIMLMSIVSMNRTMALECLSFLFNDKDCQAAEIVEKAYLVTWNKRLRKTSLSRSLLARRREYTLCLSFYRKINIKCIVLNKERYSTNFMMQSRSIFIDSYI